VTSDESHDSATETRVHPSTNAVPEDDPRQGKGQNSHAFSSDDGSPGFSVPGTLAESRDVAETETDGK